MNDKDEERKGTGSVQLTGGPIRSGSSPVRFITQSGGRAGCQMSTTISAIVGSGLIIPRAHDDASGAFGEGGGRTIANSLGLSFICRTTAWANLTEPCYFEWNSEQDFLIKIIANFHLCLSINTILYTIVYSYYFILFMI